MLDSRRDCRYRGGAHRNIGVGLGKVTFHNLLGTYSGVPGIPLSLIHPRAWKVNSQKLAGTLHSEDHRGSSFLQARYTPPATVERFGRIDLIGKRPMRRYDIHVCIQYKPITLAEAYRAGHCGHLFARTGGHTYLASSGPRTDAFPFGPATHHALALAALWQPKAGLGPREGRAQHARSRGRSGPRRLHCALGSSCRLIGGGWQRNVPRGPI